MCDLPTVHEMTSLTECADDRNYFLFQMDYAAKITIPPSNSKSGARLLEKHETITWVRREQCRLKQDRSSPVLRIYYTEIKPLSMDTGEWLTMSTKTGLKNSIELTLETLKDRYTSL